MGNDDIQTVADRHLDSRFRRPISPSSLSCRPTVSHAPRTGNARKRLNTTIMATVKALPTQQHAPLEPLALVGTERYPCYLSASMAEW